MLPRGVSDSATQRAISMNPPVRVAAGFILAAALLLPIWTVTFPPLLDYPNHLARNFVLAHLRDPAFSFNRFYRADWGLYPYLGMDASLAVLVRLLPIETAGRVFLSLCALALPAAAVFFLRQVNPPDNATPFWALLTASNIFFLEGFLNFDLSIAAGFLALGLWLRWLAKPSLARWGAVLAAFTALYFAHLLGFVIVGLVVAAYLAFSRRPVRDWAFSGALSLPGTAFYLHASRVGLGVQQFTYRGFGAKFLSLGFILHEYWPALDRITLAALGAWFLAGWWRNPEFRWNRAWSGVAAFLFVLYWAIPWQWGEGSDLDIRLLPFLFVVLLAVARVGRRTRLLAAVPLLLFAARTASLTSHFAAVQPKLAGLAGSFGAVPRGALVFPIVEGDQDPIERPFTHFWAYGVIRRGWFSPCLYDAPGETPLRITYDSYTSDCFYGLQYSEAPDWRQVQADYDYVWAYGVPKFSVPLATIGERVYGYGSLEVYRVRKPPGEIHEPSGPVGSAGTPSILHRSWPARAVLAGCRQLPILRITPATALARGPC